MSAATQQYTSQSSTNHETGHSAQKNLASKHFIYLKHAHMADLKKKKKKSIIVEQKQKEC